MKLLDRKLVRENRIYIMPTARGSLFLSLIVVMILTAATYNNNLVFILAFFLFSIFFVSMLQTHYNLKGLRLKFVGAEEAFEGDVLSLLFHLEQIRPRHKKAIRVRVRSKRIKTMRGGYDEMLPHDTYKATRVDVEAWKRGKFSAPEMIVETMYPLGIFRAWKVFRPEGEVLIYPKITEATPPQPTTFDLGQSEQGLRSTPDGDFGELKGYLPGESYHQIAWKHYARTGDLLTKVHWGSEHRHYNLRWDPPRSDVEKYLSFLSASIKHAVDENASFELETPSAKVEPGQGHEHARKCWRALAVVEVA